MSLVTSPVVYASSIALPGASPPKQSAKYESVLHMNLRLPLFGRGLHLSSIPSA